MKRHRTRRAALPRRARRIPRKPTRARVPRTAQELLSKSSKQQDTWARVTHVVAKVRRDGVSLAQALRGSGVSRQTVLRLAGASLRRLPNGRYVARTRDRLLRIVRIPVPDGMLDVALRDSKQASLVAKYWNAVHTYLATGDASALEGFAGVLITDADGQQFPLLTDRATLDRLGGAGVLSFESIYARSV